MIFTAYPRPVTALEFLTDRVGLSRERAEAHLKGGYVRVGDDIVRDPDQELPEGARPVLQPSPVTEEV